MQEVNRHVGGRIRLYRKMKHYTLEQLADRIHKSKATLSKYETGDITVDVETLFDIAGALGITVQQMLDYEPEQTAEEEKEELHGSFFKGRQVYVYFYDGRVGRIIRNLLEMRSENGSAVASLYNDVASFDRPETCRNLYFGKAEYYDTVTNFVFESQSNRMERVTLTAMNPFDLGLQVLGMLTGMSRYPMLPVSIKCILSAEPLAEDETLKESLTLSQKDVKLIRKLNMFAVEQF